MRWKPDLERLAFYMLTISISLLTVSIPTVAQSARGAFHGTVTDSTGAVIPGAKVVLTDLSSSQVREATTDDHGFYTIAQLPPAHYSVSVSKEGFSTAKQADVELLVNQDLEANYTLQVGSVSQQVEVLGNISMLHTADATLGQVVEAAPVVDLPLNGRQFTQLILLTPGAAPKEGGQQSFYQIPIGGGAITPSMNGQEGTQNAFTIDGVMDNHFFCQVAAINPPPDAIQEFNAQYHTVDAAFGLTSGANVNIVTKSGGPELHGSVYEFIRNDDLDAANFFDNFSSTPKPAYRQNQYGVSIGGPVMLPGYDGRKKHTYFFGYWEGFRSSQSFTEFANVPTAGELGGDFSDILTNTPVGTDPLGRTIMAGEIVNPYSSRQVTAGSVDPVTGLTAQSTGLVRDPFPGNVIPTSMLTQQALTYIHAFFPAANYGPGGNNFPNFTDVSPQTTTSDQFGTSLEHTFSNNDTLFGKFFFTQPNEVYANNLLLGANTNENHGRMVALGYTHLFSPTLLATLHYGYQWLYFEYTTQPAGAALLNATNAEGIDPIINNTPIVPEVSIGPRISGTNQFAIPQGPMRTHQINFDIQKVHGTHTVSAGLLVMRIHGYDNGWGTSLTFDQYPTSALGAGSVNNLSSGDGLASMLLNLPSDLQPFVGLTGADIKTYRIGAYLMDKWQASKKLNVQAGLRWDMATPPSYLSNEFSMWNSNCPTGNYVNATQTQINQIEEQCLLMPVPYAPQPTAANPNPPSWPFPNARKSLWDPRYNGWQPRLGFAYEMRPRTVVRAGFAMFDDYNQFDKEMQDPRGSWPWGANPIVNGLNHGIPSMFYNNLPDAQYWLTEAGLTIGRAANPAVKIPYSMEYNFGIQDQITPNMTFNIDYVGSESRHLWGTFGYNAPPPWELGPNAIPNAQPFPFIDIIQANDNVFNSNYNGLQVKLEKRFSEGLSFLASYTYSKCLDEMSGDYDQWPENTYDFMQDYGPCDFNFPQMFTFNVLYRLPFGHGQHFGGNVGRGLNTLIGGWNVSEITSFHSGSPFFAALPIDNANDGVTPQRVNMVPGCQLKPAGFQQDQAQFYNTACFVSPAPYTLGTSERNGLRGPYYQDFDLALFKNFKLTEAKSIQFRAEGFNVFNRVNFTAPGGGTTGAFNDLGGSVATSLDTPTFMQLWAAGPGREIQFALKFLF